MTQFIFKNGIDQTKIDVLLSMIKSWNMEVEVLPFSNIHKNDSSLSLSVGMWEGRDINDKQLREKAWGTTKRKKNIKIIYAQSERFYLHP